MNYYLMDLERTVGTGVTHYWKSNRFGYTTDIKDAGLYNEAEATEIVKEDIEKRTMMIEEKVIENI